MQPHKGCVPLGERQAQVNAPRAGPVTKKSDEAKSQDALPARSVMVTGHGIIMREQLTKSAIIASLAAGLAACAGTPGDFPSLAMRPFENGTAPEAPPPPAAAIRPPVSADRLIQLRKAAETADAEFTARRDEAARLARVAAGQPAESKAYTDALVEFAALETLRGRTAGALASLDTLAADAAGALDADPALTVTQAQVAALLAREDAYIARLWEVMGS
jgi:hypothetical protein